MKANDIRRAFFDFFESLDHKIVPSAPIVNKDDPTLMFTNAGMNQFKDYFLGNKDPEKRRIADTQKCLRVSGKHNDLEEVGLDSYHHTMFEMLGNWSFGDYFKKEAIDYAWKLLTEVYGLDKDRLYATVFQGDDNEGLNADEEAAKYWSEYLQKERILYFDKKDNFWEMGDTGPCGPCSEIHIDLRTDEERKELDGAALVNQDHPLVVEIWNLVFIQYNRKADSSLEELPEKHVDTGMGFERLCMAVQDKVSNYDTDLFTPFIDFLQDETGINYDGSYAADAKKDITFRVVIDHIRAVAFAIGDGQLPSNTGAGYVIRRILRRAVRYYYSFLNRKEPLLYLMLPLLSERFGEVFPEIKEQQEFISKIILEEEKGFLRTLDGGLKRLGQMNLQKSDVLDGSVAFELYDTYGFPIDLTRLIGMEQGWEVDEKGFDAALLRQKERSRADAQKSAGDWHEVHQTDHMEFIGYDNVIADDLRIAKYRVLKVKDKEVFQLVLDRTPFYAESGGQVGDTGTLEIGDETIKVLDTQKENDLIIHLIDKLPKNKALSVLASVDSTKRKLTENNHTATHLLHAALRKVLGDHVQQRGSLVNSNYLRFDFSHFEKMTEEQVAEVEKIVNEKIMSNIQRVEQREVPLQQAKDSGAMMLFGEKYGEYVRMITFDPDFSVELCGGCHVKATGSIGLFKIKSESAIAAGVRRIEAVSAEKALSYTNDLVEELKDVKRLFKNPTNVVKQVSDVIEAQKSLEKEIAQLKKEKITSLKDQFLGFFEEIKEINFLATTITDLNIEDAKYLAQSLEKKKGNVIILFGLENNGKANLLLLISHSLVDKGWNAAALIKELSQFIQGGGGGQPFYATAGGRRIEGLENSYDALRQKISS